MKRPAKTARRVLLDAIVDGIERVVTDARSAPRPCKPRGRGRTKATKGERKDRRRVKAARKKNR